MVDKLPNEIPIDLAILLNDIKADFPGILKENLVGIYLWGSLTYDAFDPNHSDVDCLVLTKRDIDNEEFLALEKWFENALERNRWTTELDMRFVIDDEFLDKSSRCCVYQFRKLARTGSDGNPIIWLNIGQSGIKLWGKEADLVVPAITDKVLNDALLLELDYLKADLAENSSDRSQLAFKHNAYAVLTGCRILYTVAHRSLVSKEQALKWTIKRVAPEFQNIIRTAKDNRLAVDGKTNTELEQDAARFVLYVESEVRKLLKANSRDILDSSGK